MSLQKRLFPSLVKNPTGADAPSRQARVLTATPSTPAAAPPAGRIAAALKRSAAAEAASEEQPIETKRFAQRKARNSPGHILFPGISVPFNCVVRDTSSTGARIEMMADKFNQEASTDAVPNEFTLTLPLDRIRVECKSMWRRGSKMGVKFTSTVTLMPAAPPKPRINVKKSS
jgi:hypothetical protein